MTRHNIDHSLRLISIFKKYDLTILPKEKIDWGIFYGKLIEENDIDRLLYVTGVIGDQKIINPTYIHWRNSRHYICMNCVKFKLNFEKDESNSSKDEMKFCFNER